MNLDRWLRSFFSPVVRNRREYRVFVAKVTAGVLVVALTVDVVNQLLFAASWHAAIDSWIVTVVLSASISLVASSIVGRAYLRLFEAKTAVEILSRTDSLTGLPNRRAFFDTAAACRSETMALVIADVDRFKRINDTRGHLVGDEVLRTVARLMAGELGAVGYVSRIGGEEFALLATAAPLDELLAALEAFRGRMAATPVLVSGGAVEVSISAGVAARMPGMSFDDLYADADRALYEAKTSGRNRVRLALSAQLALAATVRHAALPRERAIDRPPAPAETRSALSA